MLQVNTTTPAANSDGHYLDDSIYLQFNQEVDSAYLQGSYFQMFRCNADQSEFYDQVGISLRKGDVDPLYVILDPLTDLSQDTHYVIIVLGGVSGIKSISSDAMSGNFTLHFESGTTVRPASSVAASIDGVDIFTDGTPGASRIDDPSLDLFASEGAEAPISLLRTIPEDLSVGVGSGILDRIIFIYNDAVFDQVGADVLVGRYNVLPSDPDPFEDRTIQSSGVIVNGSSLTFLIPLLEETENREFTFKLPGGKVRGLTRQALDGEEHVLKFMGRLTPFYSVPNQITKRLKDYNEDARLGISDYDLYKAIQEFSQWARDEMGIDVSQMTPLRLSRLVTCLVLRDIAGLGRILLGGNIKSRALLATEVVYENFDINDLLGELEDCINDALPPGANVLIGIKSGNHINRSGKLYGVYR